ncbi:hypothetical protein KGF56_000375 [Candida oxycetoniae]|uniref:AN1-type domain-containing protein n=1 Tax=Candida oxycetoniae TaxID=497107 RepID=A0AAI9T1L0_9ASCO|nr:uncharacterized protein KGF56_000375 [Candida oxycetoniae]KAI3406770.1 hypothetical protein KGF56_000375 [Candida oxycetoniae]
MKVTVRLSTESSFQITIPDNSTVEDLRNGAKVGTTNTIPKDFKLIYNGVKLEPYSKSLSAFGILPEKDSINVILMSNGSDTPPISISPQPSAENATQLSATGTAVTAIKKTKKKNRCSLKSCASAPLRMVGTCSHCKGKFCAKHRLLEDHMCVGLQFCKDNAHEKNAMKLHSESTIASRV